MKHHICGSETIDLNKAIFDHVMGSCRHGYSSMGVKKDDPAAEDGETREGRAFIASLAKTLVIRAYVFRATNERGAFFLPQSDT